MRRNPFSLSSMNVFAIGCILLLACCSTGTQVNPPGTPTDTKMPIEAFQFQEAVSPQKCASPCWIGIEAGITSYDETVTILQRRYGVKNVKIESKYTVEWVSNRSDASRGGSVSFKNDIADVVHVWFGEDRLTVEDLVKVVGEPKLVHTARAFRSPGTKCTGISLDYPDIGVTASLFPGDPPVSVTQTQRIDWIEFLSPSWADIRITDSIYMEWDGYRVYCPP
jgi:hypothetical protein